MKRKNFLSILGLVILAFPKFSQGQVPVPEQLFFEDDGKIPNSKLPLLVYRQAFEGQNEAGASWLERRFESNNWAKSWRNGVYPFHHYHSTSHEVLGVYSGKALLQLGGEQGQKVEVRAGDILIIPAGVGHKNLGSENLGVVGAYPNGRSWDLLRGNAGERPQADQNIAAVPVPTSDPLLGKEGGLTQFWID